MSQKPYHSENLDEIRKGIDALDTQIHEALVQRAELVLKIGEEKRKNNIEIVQPAREARMIRRLLSKHKGVLPEMAVVRIWRELVGAVSLLQTGLKVVVANTDKQSEYWDLAKDYFGSCLPMSRMDSSRSAVRAVRDGRVNFAVVPYPNMDLEDHEENPWWDELEPGTEQAMNIIVRLPHGDDPNHKNPSHRAVVVAKTGFDGSDDDHSFILVECDSAVSRGKLVSEAEKTGFKPISLSSKKAMIDSDPRKHLVEVEGYWADKKDEIQKLAKALGGNASVVCVGGFPVPATYEKTISAQTDDIPSAPKVD
jgi:chorismate mutase